MKLTLVFAFALVLMLVLGSDHVGQSALVALVSVALGITVYEVVWPRKGSDG